LYLIRLDVDINIIVTN